MNPMRKPLNGGELLAMRKLQDHDYVVLVKMPHFPTPEYVTARVGHITDPSWFLGHYFIDQDLAMADFAERARLA